MSNEQKTGPAIERQRRDGRLRAIQALYQMDIGGIGARSVIEEFLETRFEHEEDADTAQKTARALFCTLVNGSVDNQEQIDASIRENLAKDWRLSRLDATLRALLRAAVFELLYCPKTPLKVILNEYIDLAHAFFSGPEPAFVNALLETIGKARGDGAHSEA